MSILLMDSSDGQHSGILTNDRMSYIIDESQIIPNVITEIAGIYRISLSDRWHID